MLSGYVNPSTQNKCDLFNKASYFKVKVIHQLELKKSGLTGFGHSGMDTDIVLDDYWLVWVYITNRKACYVSITNNDISVGVHSPVLQESHFS